MAEHKRVSSRRTDLWIVIAAALGCYALSSYFDLHEAFVRWLARYERWQADEVPLSALVLACGLAWYAVRRRKEAQRELLGRRQAEAQASELLVHNRELARQLIAVQENERLALARELHDELGQRCSAILVETACLRHGAAADRQGVQAAAARADAAAQDLYHLVGDLLRRLRPAHLDTLGIVAALQGLCESWEERSGIACVFHHQCMDGVVLHDALAITLYRVTQESLTNVLRHAHASSVRVVLVRRDEVELRLTIQDDGCGMDTRAATRGLGLLGAAERAAAVGGELQVISEPGAGVRLGLHIPLARAAAGAALETP